MTKPYSRTEARPKSHYMSRSRPPEGKEDMHLNQNIHTLEAMKVAKAREYARCVLVSSGPAPRPTTVNHEQYSRLKGESRPETVRPGIPVSTSWYYVSKNQGAGQKKQEQAHAHGTSPDCPDWFKVGEKESAAKADFTKAPGFDGTITLLSRINGWITVCPEDRNRSKRLGKSGPFDKSKKGNDLRNVSDLAPSWMQVAAQRPTDGTRFIPRPGQQVLREVRNR